MVEASLCHAFDPFGGLAPQLSHFVTAPSLSIAEHIGIALSYRRAVNQKLQERARQRLVGPIFYTEFLPELRFALLELAKREHQLTAVAKAAAGPKARPPVKGKGKGGKRALRKIKLKILAKLLVAVPARGPVVAHLPPA